MRAVLALLLLLAPGLAQAQFTTVSPAPALAPRNQVVCTRTGSAALGFTAASLQRNNQRMEHWCPYGARTIQLMLPGWTQGNGVVSNYRGEWPIPNSVFYIKSIKSITAGGTNYTVGDIIVEPTWGAGLTPAWIQVDAVSAGAVTAAHVLRGGAYTIQLADSTAQMAVWQNGAGFGAYGEPLFSGSNLSSYTLAANAGGMNWVLANTFISIAAGPNCTGGTITTGIDGLTAAINGIPPAGTWTCTDTTHMNAVAAISSGTAPLGSGATFTWEWGGAAYMARVSVDPTYTNESCTGNLTGACQHRTVSATTTGQPVNTGPDALGQASDIYVASGGNVLTDPIPVNVPVGGQLGVRVMLYGNVPRGRYTQLAGENGITDFATGDRTQSGTYGTAYPGNVLGFQPVAIMGIPQVNSYTPTPAMLMIADSRGAGIDGLGDATNYDVYDLTGGAVSWVERAVNNAIPIVNVSRSGDALYGLIRNHAIRYDAFKKIADAGKFPELCYQGMFVNDVKGGAQAFATVQTWEAQIVADMRAFGCKFVFTDTTDPWATSSSTTFTIPWVSIATAGTGYGANTTFTATLAGGTGTAATVSITTDAAGIPRQINSITAPGSYTVAPASPNTVTGGAGTGLTVNVFTSNFNTNQTPDATANPQLQLRNAQLRTAGFGSYAGIYDGVIDTAGITESVAASGVWISNCTKDGVHAGPNCLIQKGAFAAPFIAQWAAIASAMK